MMTMIVVMIMMSIATGCVIEYRLWLLHHDEPASEGLLGSPGTSREPQGLVPRRVYDGTRDDDDDG